MMTFPDTWEEFEKLYGFNDVEEIYTNNSRLIPSFRVKQWLDHLPSVQPEVANNSPKLDKGIDECNDCVKHSGDWECDRVHCHKGDVPDTNVGELISRQDAIDAIVNTVSEVGNHDNSEVARYGATFRQREILDIIESLPSVQPETAKRIVGKSRDGMTLWYQCDMCNEPVDVQDNYCRGCGRRLIDE